MTRRIVVRFEQWRTEPDRAPDAEPITHAIQCVVCAKQSAALEDFEAARRRMLEHAGRLPSHLTYREIIRRPWRAYLVPDLGGGDDP